MDCRWKEHRRDAGLPEEPVERPFNPGSNTVEGMGLESAWEVSSGTGINILPKGRVGAVALDIRGWIAVVTSIGGRTNALLISRSWV